MGLRRVYYLLPPVAASPSSSSCLSAFTMQWGSIDAAVGSIAAVGKRDTPAAELTGIGRPAAGAPLHAVHYVLWLLLNGGMWNSGDRILCDMFGRCEMCGWWKFT